MDSGRPERIAIVGAGPCGLACARELDRLGFHDWLLFERELEAGGSAASVVDAQGFTWDLGGHVVFSHYGEFDSLLGDVLGDEVYEHERSSFIRLGERWVPYPFQNNLRHLDPDIALECLLGLIDAPGANGHVDFGSWMQATFGTGITRHFMRPYNRKVWMTAPEEMSASWIAERVSVVDYRRALRSFVLGVDDVGWGPNSTFAFPKTGGTGEIYRRVAARLGERVRFAQELIELDPERLELRFADGTSECADVVVSTVPIDVLVERLARAPSDVKEAASSLRHTSVSVVGVGYEAPLHDDRCWFYFPDSETPFYRVTNFAKYSPANVRGADVGRYSSYLTETAHDPGAPVDRERLIRRVRGSLRGAGFVDAADAVVSEELIEVDYAYPVPTLTRDRALATIQPWLEQRRIYSRGRFGSWRYEIGNMDHAVKMGIDVARRLVEGSPEELWAA
jgi:protoporphyrinogen oxidase